MSLASRFDRLSDDALLAALALGEIDAATVFVRRWQRKVYGVAFSVTGDRVLAEDVAQQAFERAWRHAATYDPRRGAVSTWLLSITRHVAIDAMRVRRPHPLEPQDVADLLPPSSSDPSQVAEVSDDIRRVRVHLEGLPEPQRRAVLLATIGGRTMVEIGAIEGVPVPTAKTRFRTGLRKLRASMADDASPRQDP